MADFIGEWAGKERLFRLTFGGVMDLEQALGGDAIGDLFLRVSAGRFRVQDIYHTIRIALIGGGLGVVEVKKLMADRFDAAPLFDSAALAGEILSALMAGVEPSDDEPTGEAPEPIKFSEVSQICRVFHMSPLDLRDLRYADFVNLVRGYNAANGPKLKHLTDDEFEAILEKYEPEALG